MEKRSLVRTMEDALASMREALEKNDGSTFMVVVQSIRSGYESVKNSVLQHEATQSFLKDAKHHVEEFERSFKEGDRKLSRKTLHAIEKRLTEYKARQGGASSDVLYPDAWPHAAFSTRPEKGKEEHVHPAPQERSSLDAAGVWPFAGSSGEREAASPRPAQALRGSRESGAGDLSSKQPGRQKSGKKSASPVESALAIVDQPHLPATVETSVAPGRASKSPKKAEPELKGPKKEAASQAKKPAVKKKPVSRRETGGGAKGKTDQTPQPDVAVKNLNTDV